MKKTLTTAATLGALFAATFAAGYLPAKHAHTQHIKEIEQRIQHIHGEGDAGLIITDYITTGRESDNYGQQIPPAEFWQLIDAITYPCSTPETK